MVSKHVKTSGNQWKREKTSIRMVTGEVAPDARKPCAIVHEKRPKLDPTAKRAKSAGKRRKGAQCCGNVSKRAGTNGNVWKHRFGWVPGKSVSRVHGRPENPSPVASRLGTGAKVWNGVETFPNGHGNKWKRVETTIRMGTGKVGKSCSRTPRKPESGGESAGNRWKGVETCQNGRQQVETCGNNDADGYGERREVGVTDAQKNPSPVASRPGTGGEVWKHVKTGGNKWKRVETTSRMGTVKVGKSCSRTPRKPESGGESAGNRWKGVETTIRMGTVKVGKSCSRTPRKPESGGESAGNRWKGVETTIRMGTVKVGKSC